MDFASIQDWMCEPVVRARTGLTIAEHQIRTVASYLDLRELAPDVPWLPVLQGWHLDDFLRCMDLYAIVGVDLTLAPRVGVGSICRRQATGEAAHILAALAQQGLKLHAFGLKLGGLARCTGALASADSLAWSYRARRRPPMAGCTHKNCSNCRRFALDWYGRVLQLVAKQRDRAHQLALAF